MKSYEFKQKLFTINNNLKIFDVLKVVNEIDSQKYIRINTGLHRLTLQLKGKDGKYEVQLKQADNFENWNIVNLNKKEFYEILTKYCTIVENIAGLINAIILDVHKSQFDHNLLKYNLPELNESICVAYDGSNADIYIRDGNGKEVLGNPFNIYADPEILTSTILSMYFTRLSRILPKNKQQIYVPLTLVETYRIMIKYYHINEKNN